MGVGDSGLIDLSLLLGPDDRRKRGLQLMMIRVWKREEANSTVEFVPRNPTVCLAP